MLFRSKLGPIFVEDRDGVALGRQLVPASHASDDLATVTRDVTQRSLHRGVHRLKPGRQLDRHDHRCDRAPRECGTQSECVVHLLRVRPYPGGVPYVH